MTNPRLELMALLSGVRAILILKKGLYFSTKGQLIWTDSECVLSELRTSRILPTFIENRLHQ